MYTEIANHNYKGNRQIFNKQVKGQVKGLFIPLPLALASVIESDILTMNFWYDGRESPRLKKIFDFNYTCSYNISVHSENHKYTHKNESTKTRTLYSTHPMHSLNVSLYTLKIIRVKSHLMHWEV